MNVNISEIVSTASKSLKNRTLGGVTNESALSAIEVGVKEAVKKGEAAVSKALREGSEAIGKVKEELQVFKNKSAQEMAELTSQKDEIILQTKAQAKKEARKVKVFEKILPNGNKEIRKANKNGAVMVKEVSADGKNIKTQVTTLEGDYRKTTYNPQNGKPIKTFTNVNGENLIEYSAEGVMSSQKAVNVKKVKSLKPTLVTQTEPKPVKTEYSGEIGAAFDRIFSDGSKETITRVTRRSDSGYGYKVERTIVQKFDKNGKEVGEITNWPENNSTRTFLKNVKPNIDRHMQEYTDHHGTYIKIIADKIYDKTTNSWNICSGEYQKGSQKTIYKVIKDEFGLMTDKYDVKIFDGKKLIEKKVVSYNEISKLSYML